MSRTCIDCGKSIGAESRSGKCWTCLYPRQQQVEIVRLRNSGLSLNDVSAKLGVTHQAIFYAQRKAAERETNHTRERSADEWAIAAKDGSWRLLEAYHRYWLNHVAGKAA